MGNIDVRIAGNSRFCIQFRNYTRINSEWKSWSVGVQRRRRKKNILKRFKLGSILTTCWGSILNTLYSVERVGLLQLLLWRCQPRTWKYSRNRERETETDRDRKRERQRDRRRDRERQRERQRGRANIRGQCTVDMDDSHWRARVCMCVPTMCTEQSYRPTTSVCQHDQRFVAAHECQSREKKENPSRNTKHGLSVSQPWPQADWRSRGLIVPSPPARSSIVPAVLTSVTPRTRTRWCVSTKLLARASCVRSLPYRAADVCC